MKFAVISDLHGLLPEKDSPFFDDFTDVELLLICGDVSPLIIQSNSKKMKKWLTGTFTEWINSLNIPQTVFIAGNHDFYFERHPIQVSTMFNSNIKYLNNELFEYVSNDGNIYRIFGTPYCKVFGSWPFMRENETLLKYYNEIPENVDILITHDAPRFKNLGCILQEGYRWYGEEAGNEILANVILNKKPSYCFCGHIHSGEHKLQNIDGMKMANTSIVNEHYELSYKPLIVNINYEK